MEKCQCIIPPEIQHAGATFSLCHHTPAKEAREKQNQLLELMQNFTYQIPAELLITTPLNQLLEQYALNMVSRSDYQLLKDEEHAAMRISFLRQYGIAIQLLITSIITDLDPQANLGTQAQKEGEAP